MPGPSTVHRKVLESGPPLGNSWRSGLSVLRSQSLRWWLRCTTLDPRLWYLLDRRCWGTAVDRGHMLLAARPCWKKNHSLCRSLTKLNIVGQAEKPLLPPASLPSVEHWDSYQWRGVHRIQLHYCRMERRVTLEPRGNKLIIYLSLDVSPPPLIPWMRVTLCSLLSGGILFKLKHLLQGALFCA